MDCESRQPVRVRYIGVIGFMSRRKLILIAALILAIAGTLVFGNKIRRHIRRMRWENEPIRSWMSVPFIAHTHHVRPDILYQAIRVEPRQHDRRPIRNLARAENRPVADVMHDLEKAIADARQGP